MALPLVSFWTRPDLHGAAASSDGYIASSRRPQDCYTEWAIAGPEGMPQGRSNPLALAAYTWKKQPLKRTKMVK